MDDVCAVVVRSGAVEVVGQQKRSEPLDCEYEIRLNGISIKTIYLWEDVSEFRATELARIVDAAYMSGVLGVQKVIA
jgi:hypothetical protein